MRDFQIMVTDDRYRVPQLVLVSTTNVTQAREAARKLLRESAHHLEVEVLERGKPLFRLHA